MSFVAKEARFYFEEAISKVINKSDRVAIMLSGEVDSAAVLNRLAALLNKRSGSIVAFTTDIKDDAGFGSFYFSKRIVRRTCELYPRVRIEHCTLSEFSDLQWRPEGPRLESTPQLIATAALEAREMGCLILLNGSGADELLQAPRFLSIGTGTGTGIGT